MSLRAAGVAIPLKKYAVCIPYFIPRDCRGTLCLAMTSKKKYVIASVSVAIPPEKVRGIYSAFYSKGLPRHFVPRNDSKKSTSYFANAQYDVLFFAFSFGESGLQA